MCSDNDSADTKRDVDVYDDAMRELIAAEQAIANARSHAAVPRNPDLRGALIAARESIAAAQRRVHEARGERRDLLSRVAQLEADVVYWRGIAARRFVS